jgi:hypothetical protein
MMLSPVKLELCSQLLPLPEFSRPIALYRFLSGLACLLLIGCLFLRGRGRLCLRRFRCWLVLSRLILAAAARLCKVISDAGQAGLLAVAAEAGSLPSWAGWVGWLAVLAGIVGFLWVRPGECWWAGVRAASAGALEVWPC